MSTFAERLRAAMVDAGMNQTDVADKIGASAASVSQYLSGKNIPREKRIEELAEAIGVSTEYLTDDSATVARRTPARRRRIMPRDVARCLGVSEQCVRVALQRGALPFGSAAKGRGSKYNYFISPAGLRAYIGGDAYDAYFAAEEGGAS